MHRYPLKVAPIALSVKEGEMKSLLHMLLNLSPWSHCQLLSLHKCPLVLTPSTLSVKGVKMKPFLHSQVRLPPWSHFHWCLYMGTHWKWLQVHPQQREEGTGWMPYWLCRQGCHFRTTSNGCPCNVVHSKQLQEHQQWREKGWNVSCLHWSGCCLGVISNGCPCMDALGVLPNSTLLERGRVGLSGSPSIPHRRSGSSEVMSCGGNGQPSYTLMPPPLHGGYHHHCYFHLGLVVVGTVGKMVDGRMGTAMWFCLLIYFAQHMS